MSFCIKVIFHYVSGSGVLGSWHNSAYPDIIGNGCGFEIFEIQQEFVYDFDLCSFPSDGSVVHFY